jgi:carbamoyl-phosphate synthase large subunit
MKNILIFNAGGSPSTNFVRSLRKTGRGYFLVGVDCDEYGVMRAETDVKYLIPKFTDKNYFKVINKIIKKEKIDFIHVQNDFELAYLVNNIDKMTPTKMFVPSTDVINICNDKHACYEIWNKTIGIKQPKTYIINTKKDLKTAFKNHSNLWLRCITGAGGKGSVATTSYDFAKVWIDRHNGWHTFTAAEVLTPKTVTWSSIWKDGKLIVAQGRKRETWELGKLALSGVSGATGTGITVNDKQVDIIAERAILAIDPKPNGIYSVDMTYDMKGIPNPTEINIGRFFTTHYFFTACGLNMPEIYVRTAFDEPVKIKKVYNPLKENSVWIRGMDFEPILTTTKDVEKNIKPLKRMIK